MFIRFAQCCQLPLGEFTRVKATAKANQFHSHPGPSHIPPPAIVVGIDVIDLRRCMRFWGCRVQVLGWQDCLRSLRIPYLMDLQRHVNHENPPLASRSQRRRHGDQRCPVSIHDESALLPQAVRMLDKAVTRIHGNNILHVRLPLMDCAREK